MIYFLQRPNGDIKIGITIDYRQRHLQLIEQYGALVLLGIMPGNRIQERALHTQFADCRIGRSEFFTPEEKLLVYIKRNTSLEVPKSRPKLFVNLSDDITNALNLEMENTGIPKSILTRQALEQYLSNRGHRIGNRRIEE